MQAEGRDDELESIDAQDLARTAERLTALADTAELMGDAAGAARFQEMAATLRLHAMGLLDD